MYDSPRRPFIDPEDKVGVWLAILYLMTDFHWPLAHEFINTYVSGQQYATYDSTRAVIAWTDRLGFMTAVSQLWVAATHAREARWSVSSSHVSQETEQRRGEHLERRLQRVCPGMTSSLGALQDEHGHVHTDDSGIASALEYHWAHVIKPAPYP